MNLDDLQAQYPEVLGLFKQKLPYKEYHALICWLSTFFKFQLDWMLDASYLAACNKSRQIGISHTTAGVGVLWGAFLGETTTVISIGQLESTEVLEKAKGHAAVLRQLGSQLATTVNDTAQLLKFKHGGRIFALPSSGGRSFSGNVFLDEFAYQEDQEKVWDAAMGGTIHEGRKSRVVSTPNGVGDEFHNLMTNPEASKGWSLHHIPITRAVDDGMIVDMDKCWSLAKGDPRTFSQMFECAFLDGDEQYIPAAYTMRAMKNNHRCPADMQGFNYAGLDIGSTSNPTVLWVLKKGIDNIRYTQYIEPVNPTTDDDIDRLVDFALTDLQCKKICIDKTGMGEMPAKRQVERYRNLVEPIDFKEKSKETLATGMYVLLSDSQLYVPNDKKILTDFSSIKRIRTKAGNVKYDSPQRGKKGHSDYFWACSLAAHGCSQPNRLSGVITGKARRYAKRNGI